LSYTPSAVSQQILALEREAGMVLVERRPRGVVLTEAGSVLLTHATRVLAELAATQVALDELSALRSGCLRIATFATAAATVLPGAVDAFQAQYPQVEVRVQQAASEDGIAGVREGRLDLVLTVDQDSYSGVGITELFTDSFRLAIHRAHRHAATAAVSLTDLAQENWIDVPQHVAGGGVVARTFAKLGLAHGVTYESDDYTAIHEMVGAGLGIALLPNLVLLPPNENVVLRSLGAQAPSRRIQAGTRPEPLRPPAASAMLGILRQRTHSRRFSTLDDQDATSGAPRRYPAA
jgi:DNA-binding transcriptional LysR family regulator